MKSYSDLRGDGGSNVAKQIAGRKQKLERILSDFQRVIVLGSGKGGVGKSTLTMLLALGMRNMGFRPAVLDADINGPVQARLAGLRTGIPVPAEAGLAVPLSREGIGVVSFATFVPETRAVEFASLSDGDSFTWRAAKEFSTLSDLLTGTDWSAFDILLLDLPPGAEKTLQFAEFLGSRASFVLITLPSDLSRGVVRRSVSALDKAEAQLVGFIENMKGYYCHSCGEVRPLFPAGQKVELGINCLGSVPFDPRLADLCDQGLGSVQWELPAGLGMSEICQKILNVSEKDG